MRYLPLSETDRSEMLARTGVSTIDDLFADVPKNLLLKEPVDLPRRKGELEVERILSRMSARNVSASSVPFFVGAGAYKHHVPATVDHLIQRSEFLTSYTPYQPEISQGRLEALLNFQTAVADLTGLDIANASMLDEATAAAEAMTLARRTSRSKSPRFVVDADTLPQTLAVLATRAKPLGIELGVQRDHGVGERRLVGVADRLSLVHRRGAGHPAERVKPLHCGLQRAQGIA